MAAIEAELGVRLLQRTTRKLHPTDIGLDYCRRSILILDALTRLTAAPLQQQDQTVWHHARDVSAPTTFGALYLASQLLNTQRATRIVFVEMSLEDRYVDLIEGGSDMAIRIGTLPDLSPISRKFGESERQPVRPPTP